jgi:hypothetical protein
MARMQAEMLMALPEASRLRMGSGMFDSARLLLISDLRERKIPENMWPGEIFHRVYGAEFDDKARERIASHLNLQAGKSR